MSRRCSRVSFMPGRLRNKVGSDGHLPLRLAGRGRGGDAAPQTICIACSRCPRPDAICQLSGMLDAAYLKGALNYWKSSFLAQLSDDAIDTMIECFARCPTPMGQLLLEHFHGAATRINVTDTAFPHRAQGYNLLVLSEWMEQANTSECIAWARQTYTDMEPFFGSARYVNYLGDDEVGDLTSAAYGPNYRRLQEVKTKYDPGNLF